MMFTGDTRDGMREAGPGSSILKLWFFFKWTDLFDWRPLFVKDTKFFCEVIQKMDNDNEQKANSFILIYSCHVS